MHKFYLTTSGRQQEFLDAFLLSSQCAKIPSAARRERASFEKKVKPLPSGKGVTVVVTNFPELCQLNGLSCRIDRNAWMNLAVPNFLAERLGLEPLGHELALEVFGQELHISAIPLVDSGFVICSTRADVQPCEWYGDYEHLLWDSHCGTAMRLQQKPHGDCIAYPTSHVARSEERMMLLYTMQGTCERLAKSGGG